MSIQAPSTAQLFSQYRQMVYRTCDRYCKNSETAHDLCQEVFLKIHTQRQTEMRDNWAAWLYTVAVNVSLDYLRTHNRRKQLLEQWAHHFEDDSQGGEEQEWARIETDKLLGETDDLTRQIVMLHLSEGVPQGEVAKLLKTSRVTVNTRLKKFRDSLPPKYQVQKKIFTVVIFISSILLGGHYGL